MSDLWGVIGVVLGSLGGGAGLVAIVHIRKTGRKLDADAVAVLTEAATNLVTPLERRVGVLGAEVSHLRAHINEREQLAAEHSGWDYIAEEKARELGIVLPPRPPLSPARPLLSLAELEAQAYADNERT